MFSVHPKIKNISFYQVKAHKWEEETPQQIIISYQVKDFITIIPT
jgi:hypothetical protein